MQCLDKKLPVILPAELTTLNVHLNETQESNFMPQKIQFNWATGRNVTPTQMASNSQCPVVSVETKWEKNVFEKILLLETY